jgi:hypothetical protein
MVRKYRIRIDQDVISFTFTALKLKHDLLWGTVFAAKKAFSSCDVLLREFSRRGNHTGWIELKLYSQTSYLNFPYTDILQSTEIITRKRPAGELITYKFMYSIVRHK